MPELISMVNTEIFFTLCSTTSSMSVKIFYVSLKKRLQFVQLSFLPLFAFKNHKSGGRLEDCPSEQNVWCHKLLFAIERIFWSNPKSKGKFSSIFCGGNKSDTTFQAGPQKYVITAALYGSLKLHPCVPRLRPVLTSQSFPLRIHGEMRGNNARREDIRKSVLRDMRHPFL